ncbi:hypothetical protein BH09MYX1_BH09MYX1_63120 [soil metagenome]
MSKMMQVRRGGMMVLALGIALCGLGATCGNPPIRVGGSLLDFGTVSPAAGQVTRLSLTPGSPFFHWDFRDWALVGNRLGATDVAPLDPFQLPAFGLHDPYLEPNQTFGVFARYDSQHAFWVTLLEQFEMYNQHEVLLFLRDPREQTAKMRAFLPQYGTLADLVTQFPSDWQALWAPTLVPGSATFVYPPQRGWNGNDPEAQTTTPVTVSPVVQQMFGNSSYVGAAAEPQGTGSIKAVKVINHGLCSQAAPYFHRDPVTQVENGLLDLVAGEFPKAFATSVLADHCPTGNVESLWTTVSPWLDFTQEKEDAQLGGFLLNLAVDVRVTVFQAGPRMVPRSIHQWRLLDGRLTVNGEMLVTANNDGTDADPSIRALSLALTRTPDAALSANDAGGTLAGSIFHASDEKLAYAGDIGYTACDVTQSDDGRIPVPTLPVSQCRGLYTDFLTKVTGAIANVGPILGIDSIGAQQVVETLNATEVKNKQTVSKNFRCVRRAQNAAANEGTCEYVLKAKRLNILPDAVELVFIDDQKEYSNPTYLLWLHLLDLKFAGGATATAIQKLCDPPVAQTPGTTGLRLFTNLQRGHRAFTCSSCTGGCALQESP